MLLKLVERSTERLDQVTLNRLSTWVDRTRYHLDYIQRDLQTFSPWSLKMPVAPALFEQPDLHPELAANWQELQTLFSVNPSLEDIPDNCYRAMEILRNIEVLLASDQKEALQWCHSFSSELISTRNAVLILVEGFQALDEEAEKLFRAMDFRFLFDLQRQVFHIGYNVDTGRLDSNHYDLLASEARIASLVAIGKGNVPQSHWLYLARPLTEVGNTRALLSWSGTMFEYLMPSLFLRSYRNTLLNQTYQAVVQRHISYGKEKGVPWGISESGFYYLDAHQAYQYRAFGVPGLGYKRGLADDLVVAPYASLIALPFDPQAVVQNLKHFRKLNMHGLYGLYEAIDFTTERLGAGQEYGIVRSYMAHHQGMILVALDNYLFGNKMVRRFHADLRVENVELLLQEQTSQRAEIENPHFRMSAMSIRSAPWFPSTPGRFLPPRPTPRCTVSPMANFSTLITAAGSGYSYWRDLDLTRWQPDPPSTIGEPGSTSVTTRVEIFGQQPASQ
jgi:cyclic beta-1,2-glucan synthetase